MEEEIRKIYYYDENGNIIEIFETRKNINGTKFIEATELPKYTPKDGFYGKLGVENEKLVWRYIPTNPDEELTGEQFVQMLGEVM